MNRLFLNIICIGALFACMLATPLSALAGDDDRYDVDVEVSHGLDHLPTLKAAIETNTARLLRAMNVASAQGKGMNYSNIAIDAEAKTHLNDLWRGQRMRYMSFDEDFNTPISEKVTKNQYGEYEIRNIPMVFINPENPTDSHYEEIGITFSPRGEIINVYVAIERQQFQKMLHSMTEVGDESKRLTILYWMESMATAYHEKNLDWFEKFLSKDVLIVTGARKTTPSGTTFEYRDYDKEGYMAKLKSNFRRNAVIEVKFSNMTIYGHPMDDDGRIYAVECEQSWFSSTYSDVGNLFVIWDFTLPDKPQILFRGWTEKDDPTKFDINAINFNWD